MAFGLFIIGDEILSGKRTDQHFPRVRDLLAERGLGLAWAHYLGDDPARIRQALAHSFSSDDIVFCCGGIGATPDDHTRQAAAQALGRELVLHPEAERLISERTLAVGLPLTPGRLRMGEFPAGAEIIPNPVNQIPGFRVERHWFVPGFPEMAWPMLEWALDTHYADLFHRHPVAEHARIVHGLAEATLTPLMEDVERRWPAVKVFSLPRLNPRGYEIELGVKGPPDAARAAFEHLEAGVRALHAETRAAGQPGNATQP